MLAPRRSPVTLTLSPSRFSQHIASWIAASPPPTFSASADDAACSSSAWPWVAAVLLLLQLCTLALFKRRLDQQSRPLDEGRVPLL